MHHRNDNPEPAAGRSVLTVKEAAAMARVGKNTILRLVKEGILPAKRIGKRLVITRMDLNRYLGMVAPSSSLSPSTSATANIEARLQRVEATLSRHDAILLNWRELQTGGTPATAAKARSLLTFNQIVEALGGPATVAKMTGQMTSAISNWRSKRSTFPSKYYVGMRDELARRGYSASPKLWGQVGLDLRGVNRK